MPKRDPHDVLGVQRGATPAVIKAAWRRLARTNHPDLTGDDPAASSAATRRMAEINDAYAALTREAEADRREKAGERADFGDAPTTRPGGPPQPRATRPVTGRVDMSDSYRARDQASAAAARARVARDVGPAPVRPAAPINDSVATGHTVQPPLRGEQVRKEPPRASTPTGPMVRDRIADFHRPAPPTLEQASDHVIEFGKFHGHRLGDIATFEPSYIDWVVNTVTRDPELVGAARVIQADMDSRGMTRRSPTPVARSSPSA